MPYPQLVTSKRAEDARLRIEFEERARRQEAVQAQRLIDDFLVMARAQGMTPVPLRAQLMDGHEARTDKRGWYLNAKHSSPSEKTGSTTTSSSPVVSLRDCVGSSFTLPCPRCILAEAVATVRLENLKSS